MAATTKRAARRGHRASSVQSPTRKRGNSKPALEPWQETVLAYAQSASKGAIELAYIGLERVPEQKTVSSRLALLADAMRSLYMSAGITLDVLLAAGLQRTPESCDQVAAKIRSLL